LALLNFIVEPWFMGASGDSDAGKEFKEWADDAKETHGIKFTVSLNNLPPP
jgi:hypothetical protein